MSVPESRPVVRSFHHADSGTWTHIVVDSATRHAAIVDAVLDYDAPSGMIRTASAQRVLEYVATAGVSVDWVLETHAHADHLSAGAWLAERTDAKLGAGAGIVEVQRTFKRLLELGDDFAADGSAFDRLFEDGETFGVGALDVRVLAMPGHTADSIAYVAADAVFIGDTLFAPKSGTARCDFPGGDAAALHASILRLYELPDTTRVFLCHDYPTADAAPLAEIALAEQKRGNIHVCNDTDAAKFIALRTKRDAALAVPKLLWPAIQFNLRGGRIPAGGAFFKLPVAFAADEAASSK
jgi:glyoxylase-like metal-dependent hydrolase (beta-lactamase superfamily II)